MSYQLDSILQLLNPDNTMSANRLLAHAIGLCETIIYSALISKYTYYINKGMIDEGGYRDTDGKAIPIFEHKSVLDNVGIDSITQMFKAMAAYLTETECADNVMADEIVKKLRKN